MLLKRRQIPLYVHNHHDFPVTYAPGEGVGPPAMCCSLREATWSLTSPTMAVREVLGKAVIMVYTTREGGPPAMNYGK